MQGYPRRGYPVCKAIHYARLSKVIQDRAIQFASYPKLSSIMLSNYSFEGLRSRHVNSSQALNNKILLMVFPDPF